MVKKKWNIEKEVTLMWVQVQEIFGVRKRLNCVCEEQRSVEHGEVLGTCFHAILSIYQIPRTDHVASTFPIIIFFKRKIVI